MKTLQKQIARYIYQCCSSQFDCLTYFLEPKQYANVLGGGGGGGEVKSIISFVKAEKKTFASLLYQ